MKIKKIISSNTKENGKFDLSLITENDKQYIFSNCKIIGDDEEKETNMFNLTVYYDYVHLDHPTLKDELNEIYNEYYDKQYKKWLGLHSEIINKLQEDMRNSAHKGYNSYEIILNCDGAYNDKNYYIKWLKDQGLSISVELYGQQEVYEKNSYLFKIFWK